MDFKQRPGGRRRSSAANSTLIKEGGGRRVSAGTSSDHNAEEVVRPGAQRISGMSARGSASPARRESDDDADTDADTKAGRRRQSHAEARSKRTSGVQRPSTTNYNHHHGEEEEEEEDFDLGSAAMDRPSTASGHNRRIRNLVAAVDNSGNSFDFGQDNPFQQQQRQQQEEVVFHDGNAYDDGYVFGDIGNESMVKPTMSDDKQQPRPDSGMMPAVNLYDDEPMMVGAGRGSPDRPFSNGRHGSADVEIAVAMAIDEGEEEEQQRRKKKIATFAIPAPERPKWYQRPEVKRFIILSVIILILAAVGCGVGIYMWNKNSIRSAAANFSPTDSPTVSPTQAPTTMLWRNYTETVAQFIPSTDLLLDATTPHFQALNWIVNQDELALESTDPQFLQRYLLALFYFTTSQGGIQPWKSCNPGFVEVPEDHNDGNGNGNGDSTTCVFQAFGRDMDDTIVYQPVPDQGRWLSSRSECEWAGVLCADVYNTTVVYAIQLIGQELSGTLPVELMSVPYLAALSLGYNTLTGTLPVEYAQRWQYMQLLELPGNLLTGTIPIEFFTAPTIGMTLQGAVLMDNLLTGTLPTQIGSLTSLMGLVLSNNNFVGTIPTELAAVSLLQSLQLDSNELTGTIPTELARLLQLSTALLNVNKLTGALPSQLVDMVRLTELDLSENPGLQGTIPELWYNMTQLTRLSLQEMALVGKLSTRVGQLSNLQALQVSQNQLTGRIPTQLALLTDLNLLWLHNNLFNGRVPNKICNLFSPATTTTTESSTTTTTTDVADIRLEFLQADCFPSDNPPNPCACCTACCDREDGTCFVDFVNE